MTSGRASDGTLFGPLRVPDRSSQTPDPVQVEQVPAVAGGGTRAQPTTQHHPLLTARRLYSGAVTLFLASGTPKQPYSADYVHQEIKKAGRRLSGAHEVYLSIPEAQKAQMAQHMATAEGGT